MPSSREVKERCHKIVASRRLITTLQLLLAFVQEAATAAPETERASTVPLDLPWASVPVPHRSEAAGLIQSTAWDTYMQLCMALAGTTGEDGGMQRIRQLLHERKSRWDT